MNIDNFAISLYRSLHFKKINIVSIWPRQCSPINNNWRKMGLYLSHFQYLQIANRSQTSVSTNQVVSLPSSPKMAWVLGKRTPLNPPTAKFGSKSQYTRTLDCLRIMLLFWLCFLYYIVSS